MGRKKKSQSFGMSKDDALVRGVLIRRRFQQVVNRIANAPVESKYNHTYFFSPPGIGKTYSITKLLENSGKSHVKITGNVSMFAFGIQLAVINYMNTDQEKMIIFIDDTDSFLSTEGSLNQFKLMLESPKQFTYEKSLQSQWGNMTSLQIEAIEAHQSEMTSGFMVPCDNFVFIFASNIKLPTDDDVKTAREKNQSKTGVIAGKNAIRSRCNVYDFDMTNAELWGFLADVVLNTSCLDSFQFDEQVKHDILNFLWDNWFFLTERSIRLVEKMASVISEYPEDYESIWKIDFLK